MKAIVIEQPHQVAWRDVETPHPGPDELLIRSHKVGVCRTDLEILNGQVPPAWVRYPCIPGHEWSGTVVEVGRNITDFHPGDRAVCEGMIPCNRCRRCRTGQTNLCENYQQVGFSRPGGYGEFVLVPHHIVHRLPGHVTFDVGALLEPASCVLRGLERGRPEVGDAIGVIGIGTLGSAAILLARLFGPRVIIAYGLRTEELAFAKRLGADHVVDVTATDPLEATLRLAGDPLDLVIETAGALPAMDTATRIVRHGGRVVLLGIPGESQILELPGNRLIDKDLQVTASLSYTSAVFTRMVRLVEDRVVDLAPIVTHRFRSQDFLSAFALLQRREGTVAKILLEHVPDSVG